MYICKLINIKENNMKRAIFVFAAILTLGNMVALAQVRTSVKILGASDGKVENIDNVKYRITYDGKWVNNSSIKPYIYTGSEMRLDIGEKVTCFYDRTKQVKDSLMSVKAQSGNYDFSDLPKGGRFPFSYYKNYPAEGKSMQIEAVGTENYQCTEKIEIPDWQIVPDSTADIIGYHCQMAKTKYKGRTWYAWYTEDIPMQEGPWKLCGLPGLILKAYDENQEYVFSAIGMSTLDGTSPIIISKDKREELSQKELKKAKEKFTPGMVMESLNIKNVKIQDEKGNPIDMKKFMNKKNVFNPIELE